MQYGIIQRRIHVCIYLQSNVKELWTSRAPARYTKTQNLPNPRSRRALDLNPTPKSPPDLNLGPTASYSRGAEIKKQQIAPGIQL